MKAIFSSGAEINLEIPKHPRIGLSGRRYLCDNCGMIFYFKNIQPTITMKDTLLPLDIIFINESGTIVDIKKGGSKDKDLISSQEQSSIVIEVNASYCIKNDVKIGDTVQIVKEIKNKQMLYKGGNIQTQYSFPESKVTILGNNRKKFTTPRPKLAKIDEKQKLSTVLAKGGKTKYVSNSDNSQPSNSPLINAKGRFIPTGYNKKESKDFKPWNYKPEWKLKSKKHEKGGEVVLLDEVGKPQMNMEGGERIFSRIHTREIIKLAKSSPTEENLIKLGQKVASFINKQDTQKQEYVSE